MYKLLKNINFPSFVFIFFLKLLADYIALHIKRNVKIHNFYSNFTFILEPRPNLSRVDALEQNSDLFFQIRKKIQYALVVRVDDATNYRLEKKNTHAEKGSGGR